MIKHAKDLNFLEAAKLRDQITLLKKEMKQKKWRTLELTSFYIIKY